MALFGKKKKAEAAAPAPAVGLDDPFGETSPASPETTASSAAPLDAPKPKVNVYADVYTLFLGLSALALGVACVMFYLSVAKYGSGPVSGVPRAMITLFGG